MAECFLKSNGEKVPLYKAMVLYIKAMVLYIKPMVSPFRFYFLYLLVAPRRRRLSASKILQSDGSPASNWQNLLLSSPKWLTDGAKRLEKSVGQGCSLRRSTCIMRITGSLSQPPKAMRKRAAAWLSSWRFKSRDLSGLCLMLGSSLDWLANFRGFWRVCHCVFSTTSIESVPPDNLYLP